jgi:hypothetical protein
MHERCRPAVRVEPSEPGCRPARRHGWTCRAQPWGVAQVSSSRRVSGVEVMPCTTMETTTHCGRPSIGGRCSSMVNRLERSTRVPIAELRRPRIRSPSQWPGTARSAASAGRWLIMISSVTKRSAEPVLSNERSRSSSATSPTSARGLLARRGGRWRRARRSRAIDSVTLGGASEAWCGDTTRKQAGCGALRPALDFGLSKLGARYALVA